MIRDQEKQTQTNLHLESHNYQITFRFMLLVWNFGGILGANQHNLYLSRETFLAARIVKRWLSLQAMHMHRQSHRVKEHFWDWTCTPLTSESATAQGFVLFCLSSHLFFSWTISVSLFHSSKIKVFKLCAKDSVNTVL